MLDFAFVALAILISWFLCGLVAYATMRLFDMSFDERK